jgi:hypothetical protein
MPNVLVEQRAARAVSPRVVAGWTGLLVAGVVMFLALNALVRGPDFVDRVTLRNESRFDVETDVAGPDGRWLGLGTAGGRSTFVVQDVIDQGERWTFHFERAGVGAGRVSLEREELERSGWLVVVPASVEERLTADGQEPID